MNATMLEELVEVMRRDKYDVLFDRLCDTINDIAIGVAEEYCKDRDIQNDVFVFLISLSDEERAAFIGEIINTMLEKAIE